MTFSYFIMLLLTRLLLCLGLVSACAKSEFHGDSKTSAPLSEDEEPKPARDLELLEPVFKNVLVASPTLLGKVEVSFVLKNCDPSDADISGVFTVHSVDFMNPTYKATRNPGTNGAIDQTFTVSFDYKWVPEVTRYKAQQFDLTMKRNDGSLWSRPVLYAVTSSDPVVNGANAKPTREFNATEGHPGAKP